MNHRVDQDAITQRQMAVRERVWRENWREAVNPTTYRGYMSIMAWWRLEAMRGYPSSGLSLRYARNMRWAAEHARENPGTWLEICARVGYRPEVSP